MDYFNNVFTTFLGLKHCCLWVRKLSDFIKNILTCALKTSYGFGKTGWVINERIIIFLGELSKKKKDDIAFVKYTYTDIVAQKYCMIPDGPD